jgi:hypothetical protein
MFCSGCGNKINQGDKFCGSCGAQTGSAAPQVNAAPVTPAAPRPAPAPAAPRQKQKMPLIVKILAGIGIGIVLLVMLVIFATAGATKAAEEHVSFIRQKDFRSAYDKTTSQDFRAATTYDQYVNILRRFPALSYNKKFAVVSREIENNTATIKGKLTADNGEITPIIFTLIKEKGAWKIFNFRVNPDQF